MAELKVNNLESRRDNIIRRALTIIGANAADEEPRDTDVALAADALNDLIKVWQSTGEHLWARNSATVFLQPGQVKYTLGGNSKDHATENFVISSLAADVITGTTVITLGKKFIESHADLVDLAVGDYVGIRRPDGPLFWTKVKTVKPEIRLEDPAPVDLKAGARLFYYTNKIGKTLRIPEARRQQGIPPNLSEIEMVELGRADYVNLPNKLVLGTPVQFYHDPKRTFSELFVWPAPSRVDEYINMTYLRPLDIFDSAEDAADIPDEWVMALKYQLAVNINDDIMGGAPLSQTTIALADSYLQRALNWDQGNAPVFMQFARSRGMQRGRTTGGGG